MITEVVSLLQPQIEAKGQELSVGSDTSLPAVAGEAERIRQILINVLSNAHKYTPQGGQIWLTARVEDGWVRIDVRDNGIGLSPDEQAHLFDRSFAPDNPPWRARKAPVWDWRSRVYSSRCIGGRIGRHQRPGEGSTFSFTLPMADVPQGKLQGRVIFAHHTVMPRFLLVDYPRIALASGPGVGRCTSAAGWSKNFKRIRPGETPVEVNPTMALAINLKVAKTLGLTTAPELLHSTDRLMR